jgi:hypothetical protein
MTVDGELDPRGGYVRPPGITIPRIISDIRIPLCAVIKIQFILSKNLEYNGCIHVLECVEI